MKICGSTPDIAYLNKFLNKSEKYRCFYGACRSSRETIVFAGATGSGKTTYMKSLIDFIPLNTRLITIEDAEEIKFFIHKNYVHLFTLRNPAVIPALS
ncbi:ATPase, T2SS/T4P/T4SS family [Escherichia coli]|uniref:ATPase, T2SS/T4P/T4SS family n=1 Tax=Escherichia coli TaxID=562 RepID=UPI001F482F5E|nr:ATPase, T2SS/T4P/T4SS family [Escherichia coli]